MALTTVTSKKPARLAWRLLHTGIRNDHWHVKERNIPGNLGKQVMNAILSKDVMEQISALSLPPGNIGKKPAQDGGSPFLWYSAAGPAKCWKCPEPPQCVVHFPELISAFGERAFTAHWR